MSLIPLLFPLHVTAITDEAKRVLRHDLEKQMAAEFDLSSYDYSKCKSGQDGRDLGLGRVMRARLAVQWAVLRAWERALVEAELPEQPAQINDADLVEDLLVLVGRFKKRMARMELPAEERKTA